MNELQKKFMDLYPSERDLSKQVWSEIEAFISNGWDGPPGQICRFRNHSPFNLEVTTNCSVPREALRTLAAEAGFNILEINFTFGRFLIYPKW